MGWETCTGCGSQQVLRNAHAVGFDLFVGFVDNNSLVCIRLNQPFYLGNKSSDLTQCSCEIKSLYSLIIAM